MIASMTGFGRGIAQSPTKRIQIEIKSVNSKQLDLSMRFPPYFKEMEVTLRNPAAFKLGRGKVEVWATVENLVENSNIDLNFKLLESYKLQLQDLGVKLKIGEPKDWFSLLLRLPDSMKTETAMMNTEDEEAFKEAFSEALKSLVDFREIEGKKLYDFFVTKIDRIKELLELINPYEEERIIKIRERLEEQLSKLTSLEYDKGRLEQEMIFYIEKLDVTEEKVRLNAHLNYFIETLNLDYKDASQGQGKKLGFIAQEMGREINTLGSKANHAEMQKIVVMMKDELEQIKEQVLNVL